MKAPFSKYLDGIAGGLKDLIKELGKDYSYVSVLATDSKGFSVRISQHAKRVSNQTMTTERGTVVRVHDEDGYCEYALDSFDPAKPMETAQKIKEELEQQKKLRKATGMEYYPTGSLSDEELELFVEKETIMLPEETKLDELIGRLCDISDRNAANEEVIDCLCNAQSTHVCKMFLSANRDLRQSYVYSEGGVVVIAQKDGRNQYGNESVSGLCGPEIFTQLEEAGDKALASARAMLQAVPVVPGEYEIITSPEVTGLIAHEAFGHGVEMDMFVKERALGAHYIGKRVGSDLLTMHEGALCAESVTSYAFDDEGTLAKDTVEIEKGILKTGICDALSALRLGIAPTGNGKRENFAHKAYTRMTNTMIDSGDCDVQDMIKSIKHGYLLEGMESGMEDPKHWGIQCIVKMGREIKDGRLTGKIVGPVIMTGYVPDLLSNITMLSHDRKVSGAGGCGKGYKEFVKTAEGGPYMKTKGMLG